MDEELKKLQRQISEMVYLLARIDEQMDTIAGEFSYLESLIRQSKDIAAS